MGDGLTRRAVALGRVQTGEGVAAVLHKGLNGLLLSDLGWTPEGEVIERNFLRDAISPLPHQMGRKLMDVTFGFELKSGPAAGARPEWSPLMRAAGMSETISATVTSIRTAALRWVVSAAGAGIFYVELIAGGDPSLTDPKTVRENGQDMIRGTSIPALNPGQFFYGTHGADALGFNTIYARLTDDADPDSKALAYVETVSAGVSIIYTFRDTGFEFGTFDIYIDGLLIHVVDAIVDITGIQFNAGASAIVQARLRGAYETPTSVTLPTLVNYQSHIPARAASMAFTIDGYALGTIPSFSINFGNQIAERRDVNSPNGYKGSRLVSRAPVGQLQMEQEIVATFPAFARWDAATVMVWSAVLGSAGTRITMTSPGVQFTSIRSADIGGIRGWDVGLKFSQPASVKELTLTLD